MSAARSIHLPILVAGFADMTNPAIFLLLLVIFLVTESRGQTLERLTKPPPRQLACAHCSFAYSALAGFRMGMSGSASFRFLELNDRKVEAKVAPIRANRSHRRSHLEGREQRRRESHHSRVPAGPSNQRSVQSGFVRL